MPVPKKKQSRMRRGNRRAHDFLVRTFAIVCPECGAAVLRHRVCGACGYYRGKQIISIAANA